MRDAPCHNYSISHTAPLDECKCGWPKRDHGVRKSCPTCEHKWLDTQAPLSPGQTTAQKRARLPPPSNWSIAPAAGTIRTSVPSA